MRRFRTLAVLASLTVAGCTGANVSPGAPATGDAALHRGAPTRIEHDKASYKRALYVADAQANDIKILTNTYYRELGTITDGINEPVAESMDQRANLYVANYGPCGSSHQLGCGDVTEYAPGTSAPSFTYNANMYAPLGVAVDRHGNVFEADRNGYVNQYFQGSNYAVQSCLPPSLFYPVAISVDLNGDVFVAYKSSVSGDPTTSISEYTGGLSGCNRTALLNEDGARDLVLDSSDNLIVSVSMSKSIDVLDPPYGYVTRQIGSGFFEPRGMSLSKKNKLLFVADDLNDNVTVINYQTGYNIKVLGASYGLVRPIAVVDAPNAVY